MAGVTSYPLETNPVLIAEPEEFFPKVPILGQLLVPKPPSVRSPAARPTLLDGVHQVSRVAEELYLAWFLQRGQTSDGGSKLHPIIRGAPIPSRQLPAVIRV